MMASMRKFLPRGVWTVTAGVGVLVTTALGACVIEEETQNPGPTSTTAVTVASTSVNASSSSSVSSSTTGAGGMGGAGGAEPMNVCGDGKIVSPEMCDDGKPMMNGDGCSADCQVEDGYYCTGEPSVCLPIEAVEYGLGPGIAAYLKDGVYDGTLDSMRCVSVLVDSPHDSIQWVRVHVGVSHDRIGELIIKVRSAEQTVITLMNRPGYGESADDGAGLIWHGENSNLDSGYPVIFRDDAAYDAELMGDNLWAWEEVCKDDNRCEWKPNAGSATAGTLSDLAGEDPSGSWRVCVGDWWTQNFGLIDRVKLTILAD